jgi:mRNA-degrading endonuclease RelE of RelBE toxin-antitoxin system
MGANITNALKYQNRALRQLRKLPLADSKEIFTACRKLENFPACQGVKALTNHLYQYRLRVGKYRVFFNFDGAVHIVSVEEVKKRDEHTY